MPDNRSLTIRAWAFEAACAAYDAHACNPPIPPAETGYDFLRTMMWESYEGAGAEADADAIYREMALTSPEWILFRLTYDQTVKELTDQEAVEELRARFHALATEHPHA